MEPGECVFTGSQRANGQPAPDEWHLEGELKGPNELYLHSGDRTLTLQINQSRARGGQQGGHHSQTSCATNGTTALWRIFLLVKSLI